MEQQPQTGYPSIDKPWLRYYSAEAIQARLPVGTAYEYLFESNKAYLEDIALRYFSRSISYRTLFMQIDRVESALRACGIAPGDIVVICMPSTPEVVYLFYALSKIGAVANMIDPRTDAAQLRRYLTAARTKLLLFIDRMHATVAAAIEGTDVATTVAVSAAESLWLSNIQHVCRKRIPSKNMLVWRDFLKRGARYSGDRTHARDDGAPVLMTYTSGTTGSPKGVLLTNRNVNAVALQYKVAIRHERGQKYLCIIPPFIAFGICAAVHMPLCFGVTSVLVPQFDPARFDRYLLRYRPEHFTCTPLHYEGIIKSGKLSSLSYLITAATGGDAMPVALEKRINAYLAAHGCSQRVLKGYGMTEVSSSACSCWERCNAYGSVGIPLVDMVLSIFEPGTETELPYRREGEICFTGPNVMRGYHRDDAATRSVIRRHRDGNDWVHSGDIGYMTEDGLLYVVDRVKRTVHLGCGHDLLPSKVEREVIAVAGVKACVAVGAPHPEHGTVLLVYIVPEPNCGTPERELQERIRERCMQTLPAFAVPSAYVFRTALPLTPVGKIDYRALAREAAEKPA